MLVKASNCSSSRLLHQLCLRPEMLHFTYVLAHERRVSVSSAVNMSVPGAPLMFSYAQLTSFIVWQDKPIINPDATAMTHAHALTNTHFDLSRPPCFSSSVSVTMAFLKTFTNSHVVETAESNQRSRWALFLYCLVTVREDEPGLKGWLFLQKGWVEQSWFFFKI